MTPSMAATAMKPCMTTAMGEGKMSGSEAASVEMVPTPVMASTRRPTPKRYEATNDGAGTSHVIVACTSGEQQG
jgi:hypothetical protein